MDGEAIFFTGRGGARKGKAKNLWGRAGRGGARLKIYGAGRGTPPPLSSPRRYGPF